jgi:glutaconate CoA-transferase, subunit A
MFTQRTVCAIIEHFSTVSKSNVSLTEAIRQHVSNGDCVALEGFTHLIPFAAGHEIIRQRRRNLTLVRLTPDLIYDQMIGMGCAKKLVFSWGGNPGVGSLHRFRDAVEKGWPGPLEIDERSHAAMSAAYVAGAAGVPIAMLRGFVGSDLPNYNTNIRFIECPFTGEKLAATPAINPDVAIIHAQKADRQGNILLWGIVGVQKEIVLAAKRCIVTVEETVDDLEAPPNAYVLPAWAVDAVCEVPGGAFPSYADGYYARDNAAYIAWDAVSKSREQFTKWMGKYVLDTENFSEFRHLLAS